MNLIEINKTRSYSENTVETHKYCAIITNNNEEL